MKYEDIKEYMIENGHTTKKILPKHRVSRRNRNKNQRSAKKVPLNK